MRNGTDQAASQPEPDDEREEKGAADERQTSPIDQHLLMILAGLGLGSLDWAWEDGQSKTGPAEARRGAGEGGCPTKVWNLR